MGAKESMGNHAVFPRGMRRRGNDLVLEGQALSDLAKRYGTPLYVYGAEEITAAYADIDAALSSVSHVIAYAVKANGNLALLKRFQQLGAGADVVSAGELERALKAGIHPERIVFSGVGKRAEEIDYALSEGIRSLNVESAGELDVIERLAKARQIRAHIGLRINPNVDAATHPYIATGLHDSKFGLELDAAEALLGRVGASDHLLLESVGCHIGSQLGKPDALEEATLAVGTFALRCQAAGHRLTSVDIGGGWPIAYGDEARSYPEPAVYGAAALSGLRRSGLDLSDLTVLVEPGRSLVGRAGVLLTEVLYVKERPHKHFVIVDAGMTEALRPALYDAYHHIVPVASVDTDESAKVLVDVVGPVCETGDFLALGRRLPELASGDLLAVLGCGAYCASMGMHYNARPRAAEVLVEGDSARIIRERETPADQWRLEHM